MWAPNSPEWLLMEFGAALAGLTLVTVNPALRTVRHKYSWFLHAEHAAS